MELESRASKRHYWIVEYRNGEPHKAHHIVNPSLSERGWYVHILSTDGFSCREDKRLLKAESKGVVLPVRYSVRRQTEWQLDLNHKVYGDVDLPVEERGTIFDFYKHIGFDHKKNRFTGATTECPAVT